MFSIELARREERPQIFAFVEEANLPQDRLGGHLSTILVPRREERIMGSAALELCGLAALLRSITIRQNLRGAGLGRRLTEATLRLAREPGVVEAYLLTEAADLFFPRFGFRPVPRSEGPQSMRRSVEFTSACPAGARAMVLNLKAG